MIDTITAKDIFNSLVEVLNRMGIYCSRAVGIAADSTPSLIAKTAGVGKKVRYKVQVVCGGRGWTFHCISYQEALCCKSLKLDHVMQVVVRTVNFSRTITVSLTAFSVIRRFFICVGKLKTLCANNHFQISLNVLH